MPAAEYRVSLADLITIADAACHLAGYHSMLVDKPAEQDEVHRYETALHDIVERAAREDAWRVYGDNEKVSEGE